MRNQRSEQSTRRFARETANVAPMRFVVFGAGAIGSGIGGHLHRTGHAALIVGRPAHVNRIRQHGLQLITDEQTYTLSVPAVSRAADVTFSPNDVLLLC